MIGDRIRETTSTTGTGTWTLNGAVTGFVSFASVIGTGNQCYYEATDGFGNWEAGIGTVTGAAPYQLSRDTVIESSNSNTAVNFLNTVTVRCGPLSEMLGPIGNRFSAADTTGGANAYNLTLQPTPRTLQHLMRVVAKASFANTGACTLNLNGTGPLPLRKGDGTTDLASGDLLAGSVFVCYYDAPNSRWLLASPTPSSTSGFALLAAANTFTLGPQTAPSWITTAVTGGDKGAGTINAGTIYEAGNTLASVYAKLAAANAFTAIAQNIANSALGDFLILQSTDAGAAVGPDMVIDRFSASPAASDLIGRLIFRGRSSTAAARSYAAIYTKILDAANTSEDAEIYLQSIVAGTLADRLVVGQGIYTPGATGTDKGTNTINASTLYIGGAFASLGYQQWGGTSAGTANAQTISLTPALTAYTAGLRIGFVAGSANTSAVTLNVNSLGAKNIFNFNQACLGGELNANELVFVVYDGTQFQLAGTNRAYGKQTWFPPFALTDGASIAWDVSVAQFAKVTLTASGHTFSAPTNVQEGATYILCIAQDGTGSRTCSYNAKFDFGTAGSPTLTTTLNKVDILTFVGGSSSTMRFIGITKGFAE